REERQLHVAARPPAVHGRCERSGTVRGRRPPVAVSAPNAEGARTRDLVRVPGADDLAQSRVRRGPADRGGAAPAPGPVARAGAGPRARAAPAGPDPGPGA